MEKGKVMEEYRFLRTQPDRLETKFFVQSEFYDAVLKSNFKYALDDKWQISLPVETSLGILNKNYIVRRMNNADGSRTVWTMNEEEDCIFMLYVQKDAVYFYGVGATSDAVSKYLIKAKSLFVTSKPEVNQVSIKFWYMGNSGPTYVTRNIDVPSWAEIENNYPLKIRKEISSVIETVPDTGRIILWQGEPGTGKCVAKGTKVITPCGYHNIEELHPGRFEDTAWETKLKVASIGGFKDTSHFYSGGIQKTIRLETQEGYTVEGTTEHPVLTLRKDAISNEPIIRWIPLSQLKDKDYVAVDRSISMFGNIEVKDAYIYGLIVGDGHIVSGKRVILSTGDKEILEEYSKWCQRFGNIKHRSGYDYSLDSREAVKELNDNGINAVLAPEKTIPNNIWKSDLNSVAAFLQGLFDADGYASKLNGHVEITSASEHLLRGVQLLFLKFGIISSFRRRKTLHTYKSVRKCGGAWRLSIYGEDARKFYDRIGFRLARKQALHARLPCHNNPNRDGIPFSRSIFGKGNMGSKKEMLSYERIEKELLERETKEQWRLIYSPKNNEAIQFSIKHKPFWSRVKTLENSMAQVFDLTIPETHAFVANGIIVHNTYALRSLCKRWAENTKINFIIDPDVMFGKDTSYMMRVFVGDDDEGIDYPVAGNNLFILEDAGEMLRADAREYVGQALSRLFNITDGLIGQGTHFHMLVTTNEDLGKLHPAITRHGRCSQKLKFESFTPTEASQWLTNHVDSATIQHECGQKHYTLAELYAIKHGGITQSADAISKIGF